MGRTTDPWEEKAKVSQGIPGGFGGISNKGIYPRKVIYLVDTTQLTAAVPALEAAGLLQPNLVVGATTGRWTYVQLYDWFRYIHMHLRGVGVVMWALDEWRNRIYYGVEDEAAAANLDRRLAELRAPCFLVALEVTGRVQVANGSLP
jgi:hypothetical protein